MNEATQTAAEPITKQPTAIPPYPLDQSEFEVTITIPGRELKLEHKLTRPTLAQLLEREEQSSYETESVSDAEDKVSADDEQANARLWDSTVRSVKGYRLDKLDAHPLTDWRDVTPELKAAIPSAHKATAVRGMYQSVCEIEKANDDEGFTLGGETWTVKQTFGDPDDPQYMIGHILRTPTEAERRDFKRKAAEIRFGKGQRKLRTKVVTHLKAHVELYDKLIEELTGVTTQDLKLVDPIFKRQAIDCLMRGFEAGLQD